MLDKKNKKKILTRLKSKYRLVIMNEETFEEKASLTLSPLGLFTLIGSISIFLIVIVIYFVAFTPLREYIPGYADVHTRRHAVHLISKADSLEEEIRVKDLYLQNIHNIISGKDSISSPTSQRDTGRSFTNAKLDSPSKEDSMFRREVEAIDRSITSSEGFTISRENISSLFFFTPITGTVSHSFSGEESHWGVDVVAPENEAVKATLDGTIILSTWTPSTGHVVQIQHSNNLVSIYKHNSVILKKEGANVKAGEAIAIIGNSGELTSGPHLHFELWHKGTPLNPQEFMQF